MEIDSLLFLDLPQYSFAFRERYQLNVDASILCNTIILDYGALACDQTKFAQRDRSLFGYAINLEIE
jgi:hypothetical protein